MIKLKNYSSAVLQAIGCKYDYAKERKRKLNNRLAELFDRKIISAKNVSYVEYAKVTDEISEIAKDLRKVETEIDIWDEAIAICLNLLDKVEEE